jgi:hypothetical protein
MENFIKDVLVKMHKETTTDKYGQVHRSNFTLDVFGDKKEDVKQYCEKNGGVLQFATYSAVYGTYTAFTIEDKEIRDACEEALSKNENYINNMCSW